MINKTSYNLFLVFLFIVILLSNPVHSNNIRNDSLTIKIFGEFKKNQKFILKYNNEKICSFGGTKKVVTVKVQFDSSKYSDFSNMNFCIFKWSHCKKTYVPFNYPFIYYPGMKYIIIYYLPYITKGFLIYSLPYFKHVIVIDNFNKL